MKYLSSASTCQEALQRGRLSGHRPYTGRVMAVMAVADTAIFDIKKLGKRIF